MKKMLCLLALLVVGMMLTGCQNTVNTVENADKSANPNYIEDSRFVTDGFLKRRLRLNSVKMAPADNGCMRVEIAATNVRTGFFAQMWSGITAENPYAIDYKFVWQDKDGFAVESAISVWKTIRVKPGETIFLKSVAPSPQCKDFILNLRESKNIKFRERI